MLASNYNIFALLNVLIMPIPNSPSHNMNIWIIPSIPNSSTTFTGPCSTANKPILSRTSSLTKYADPSVDVPDPWPKNFMVSDNDNHSANKKYVLPTVKKRNFISTVIMYKIASSISNIVGLYIVRARATAGANKIVKRQ